MVGGGDESLELKKGFAEETKEAFYTENVILILSTVIWKETYRYS